MRSGIEFYKFSGTLRHEAANLKRRSSQEAKPEPGTARLQPCAAASLEHLNRTNFDDAVLRKTIGKAQQGDAAAFETIYHLYRAHVFALSSHAPRSNRCRRCTSRRFPTTVPQDSDVSRRIRILELAASLGGQCRVDAHASEETGKCNRRGNAKPRR